MPQQWDLDAEIVKSNRCQACGAHVTLSFRQGYGDENDLVFGCPSCETFRDLGDGRSALTEGML